jgi:type I restriction enzyme S subunit
VSDRSAAWRAMRLRDTVVDVRGGTWGSDSISGADPLCVRVADFDRERLVVKPTASTLRHVESSSLRRMQLKAGDLLLEKSGGGEKQNVGAVVFWGRDDVAVCSNFIARVRCSENALPRFLVRLHFALYAAGAPNRSTKQATGIQNLDVRSYLDEPIFLPEKEEQSLIVRYLDHAELRIAKAIAAKQHMIALLDEREELALLQAITQSDRPMTTDSRLDWLGEFPAHWDVKRLGSLLEERNEMNADRQVQQVLSLVRKRGVMRYEDKGRIGNKRSDDVARYKVVREGDIVLNSMNVIIGSVGQSSYTGCLSPVYYVLKPRSNEHHNAYFNALFQVERFHSSLVRFGKGILAHRMRIPMIDLKTVMLPVPPPDEQLAIADRVVKATAELRAAKAGIEAEIALLKEYRVRLISDVVTGKLDVRDEAAKLPDIDPMELATVVVGENDDDEEATDDD